MAVLLTTLTTRDCMLTITLHYLLCLLTIICLNQTRAVSDHQICVDHVVDVVLVLVFHHLTFFLFPFLSLSFLSQYFY